jgi:hypothetical protein
LKEEVFISLPGTLFGDKAYRDQATTQALAAQGTTICTPDKKEKDRKFTTSAKAVYGLASFPPCGNQSSQFSIGWWRKPAFRMLPRFVPVKACEFTAMGN